MQKLNTVRFIVEKLWKTWLLNPTTCEYRQRTMENDCQQSKLIVCAQSVGRCNNTYGTENSDSVERSIPMNLEADCHVCY